LINTIRKNYYIKIILLITILLLIFGGGSLAQNKKKVFEVYAEKAPQGIKTTFQVWAYTEDEAKENLSLNGWKILNIKMLNQTRQVDDLKNKQDTSNNNDKLLQHVDNFQYNTKYEYLEPNLTKLKFVAEVYFDLGKYDADLSALDNVTFSSDKEYFIYGYTDSLPVKSNDSFKTNYELSILRSERVKKYLIEKKGLKDENLKIAGFGEFYPKEDNTFNGNPANRRVEVYEYK